MASSRPGNCIMSANRSGPLAGNSAGSAAASSAPPVIAKGASPKLVVDDKEDIDIMGSARTSASPKASGMRSTASGSNIAFGRGESRRGAPSGN